MGMDTWPLDHTNPVELNRYVYAAGNPVTYGDPSGFTISIEVGGSISGIGRSIPGITYGGLRLGLKYARAYWYIGALLTSHTAPLISQLIDDIADNLDDNDDTEPDKLYRGTSHYNEIAVWMQTGGGATGLGAIMSDIARETYSSSGNIGEALKDSLTQFEQTLNDIGDLQEYLQQHGQLGATAFSSQYGGRTLISLTENECGGINSAEYFANYAGSGGMIFEVDFDDIRGQVFRQPLGSADEGEWLAVGIVWMVQSGGCN